MYGPRPKPKTAMAKEFVLPRKLGDRLLAFVLSCVLTGFFALEFARLDRETPIGWLRKALQVLGIEVMFTFGIFSVLALIWAVFTPRSFESFLNRSVRKVLATIAIVVAATVFTVLYYTVL
jgi:hypothetical protein